MPTHWNIKGSQEADFDCGIILNYPSSIPKAFKDATDLLHKCSASPVISHAQLTQAPVHQADAPQDFISPQELLRHWLVSCQTNNMKKVKNSVLLGALSIVMLILWSHKDVEMNELIKVEIDNNKVELEKLRQDIVNTADEQAASNMEEKLQLELLSYEKKVGEWICQSIDSSSL